jgi:transposase|tara:strand:+ start:64 stop:1854 length:1791 start_codon:yes stop_codon:yes gene_type:complete
MPVLGKRPNQRGLFEADTVYLDFVGRDSFYGFLAAERGRVFRDEDFADLYCHTNGRNSVPPSLLATALILQSYDRVSDAEAKDRADYDLRWKVALGTELKERPFAKSTLQLFRAQLIIHDKARDMFRRSLQKAKESGFFRRRKKLHAAVDTMVILGRGAVKDTYNLLADGIAKLSRVLAELAGAELTAWAGAHGMERYFAPSIKGTAEVDWDEAASRQAFLGGIVADADALLEHARQVRANYPDQNPEAQQIAQAADLLMQLLAQDIERKDDGPEIKQGVAKDRIVSVHDPEMRHGRKSSKARFEGHKGAVMVDAPSQFVTAVGVAPGGAHDGDTALALVEQSEQNTGLQVAETVGDCAYGDDETRRQFVEAERKIIAPVPSPPRTGKFPKTAFRIGRRLDRVSCPAGCTTRKYNWVKLGPNRTGRRQRVKRFAFAAGRCGACELRSKCLGGRGPRTVTLHPQEIVMQRGRHYQSTEGFREAKRRRQVVEHRIARLGQLGAKQARYIGRAKTLFQVLMAATVANLTLIAAAADWGKSFLSRLLGHIACCLLLSARWLEFSGRPTLVAQTVLTAAPGLKRPGLMIPGLKNPAFRPRF